MTPQALDISNSLTRPSSPPIPRLSWRGRAFNLAIAAVSGALTRRTDKRSNFDVAAARRGVHIAENMMAPAPTGMRIEAANGAPVAADWIAMPHSRADRILLFVHSGSFILGRSKLHQSLAARICDRSGAMALSVDYRLAPEHPFPAAIEDVAAAYSWLLAQGTEPSQIQFLGDSAGGGIALGALLLLRERGISMPAGLALLAPWADLTLSGRSILTNASKATLTNNIEIMMICRELYLQGHTPADPLASPVFADLQGLPPTFIQASIADILLDDTSRLDGKLRHCEISCQMSLYPPMPHGWQRLGSLLPESRRAIEEIATFVEDRFSGEAPEQAKTRRHV